VVYGPCAQPAIGEFIDWMTNLQIADADNWLLIGDFNFYCSLEDRNKPGEDFNDTLIFNEPLVIWV
jgi:hypothetical protein